MDHPRLIREWKTVRIMIEMFCENHHDITLCNDCTSLQDYCEKKLDTCIFQENKPTCSNCPIHCYRKSMKNKIKEVMRYSGPKMIFSHPTLAILHILDKRHKPKILFTTK